MIVSITHSELVVGRTETFLLAIEKLRMPNLFYLKYIDFYFLD